MIFIMVLLISLSSVHGIDINVLMSEVFAITIDPPMFNWTYEGIKDQFVYQASLLNSPDLPSWINYVYSERHHAGFLYGVAPKTNQELVPLEVIALNKKTYETNIENIHVIISEKRNPAKYEVHMKIDNLNVEDMFDIERMDALKDIFRKQLWKDSEYDLYITFLSSAVELGARKPPNPNEGEGVVIRLGSESTFSTELIELQEEVKPLWKVPACPRDFKRTSVERYFRDAGFALDWCSFRLIDNNNSAMHHLEINRNLFIVEENEHIYDMNDRWKAIATSDLPRRSYTKDILVSVLVPLIILFVSTIILFFLLCFHHDELAKYNENNMSEEMDPFQNVQTASESLRNFSTNREQSLSPDMRSHTNSPNSTISRGVHCRPSPPPYVRPKFKPEL